MNDEILQILLIGNTKSDLPDVVEKLKRYDEKELFENLFSLSVQKQEIGKGVAFAGYALNEINPKSQISAYEAVSALLAEWDVSIEEVVSYLIKQYGKEVILKETENLKSQFSEGDEFTRIKAIEYWAVNNA